MERDTSRCDKDFRGGIEMRTVIVSEQSFDLIKQWIIKNRGGYLDPDYQIERYAWLRDNVKGRMLSIGCGEAKIEEYIFIKDDGKVERMQPVYGADINPMFIDSASERWPQGRFVHVDICKDLLPFDNNAFDTVVMGDVIEHIRPIHFHRVLSEALRVCKPTGHVLITTPNGSYLDYSNASAVYSADHCCIFTEEIINSLLIPNREAQKWWIVVAGAKHNFDYNYEVMMPASEKFIFVDIQKKAEKG